MSQSLPPPPVAPRRRTLTFEDQRVSTAVFSYPAVVIADPTGPVRTRIGASTAAGCSATVSTLSCDVGTERLMGSPGSGP
jgi:hypothetical protein